MTFLESDSVGGAACGIDPTSTVSSIGEKATIGLITSTCVCDLNGDDAAVLPADNPNTKTVVTTDALVEGVHFRRDWSTARQIGIKAVTQNVSDLEAMGARPRALLLAACLPPSTTAGFVSELAEGIRDAARVYPVQLVGGDITSSPVLVFSITALGTLTGPLPAATLGGAHPGQDVILAGRPGWSAAGLELLTKMTKAHIPDRFDPLVRAHLEPRAQINKGVIARAAGATAMTDTSDGLIADAMSIARASGVCLELDGTALLRDPLLEDAGRFLGTDPENGS